MVFVYKRFTFEFHWEEFLNVKKVEVQCKHYQLVRASAEGEEKVCNSKGGRATGKQQRPPGPFVSTSLPRSPKSEATCTLPGAASFNFAKASSGLGTTRLAVSRTEIAFRGS